MRWTGGQYSLYRALFGTCLFLYFIVPRQVSPLLAAAAAVAAVFFAIGLYDRIAAIVLWCALTFLFGLPFAGVPLLAHLFIPPAPYGSWAARGRVDPRGNWSMPRAVVYAAWVVLALGYISMAMLPIDFAGLVFGIVILHLLTFDPAWVPRRAPATTDRVLYDGSCGLCHRSVRFLIAEDAAGTSFVFVPQEGGGATVIVETADGRTLTKSDAVIHLAHRLGGLWRVLGIAFSFVPRVLRDRGYDFIARIRYRIFGKTKDACPLMPPDLRSRFF